MRRARPLLIGVLALMAHLAVGSEALDLRFVLPKDLYAVPGVEMNVYFDNIVLATHSDRLLFDVDCDLGVQQTERWTCLPTAEQLGDHALTVRVLGPEVELIEEATATVHVIDPEAGAGEEITVLCVGDSLTAASRYTARLVELFGQEGRAVAAGSDRLRAPGNPRLRLIGEAGPGADTGNRHEGYGGWTCNAFASRWSAEGEWAEIKGRQRRQRSPFLFEVEGEPRLDFQRYLDNNNGGQPPDFITILLGCNDTFSATEETIEERIDAMFANLDQLLTEFRSAAAHTQIGVLLLVPPAATQDAFGANYKCGQTRWQYRRNQHRVVEREMAEYGGGEEQNLFLIPAHVNLDTRYGFPISRAPANAHATDEIPRLCNGVHPSATGYYQIGDSIYCWLKSRLGERIEGQSSARVGACRAAVGSG